MKFINVFIIVFLFFPKTDCNKKNSEMIDIDNINFYDTDFYEVWYQDCNFGNDYIRFNSTYIKYLYDLERKYSKEIKELCDEKTLLQYDSNKQEKTMPSDTLKNICLDEKNDFSYFSLEYSYLPTSESKCCYFLYGKSRGFLHDIDLASEFDTKSKSKGIIRTLAYANELTEILELYKKYEKLRNTGKVVVGSPLEGSDYTWVRR